MVHEVDQRAVVVLQRGRQRLVLGELGPDRCHLTAVDDLARLCVAAERFGWRVRLEGASEELFELLDLCGLAELLGS